MICRLTSDCPWLAAPRLIRLPDDLRKCAELGLAFLCLPRRILDLTIPAGRSGQLYVRVPGQDTARRAVDIAGFDLTEFDDRVALWVRGGLPRSFLAERDAASMTWREGYVRTFLERDIPQLGISIPAESLRRFWTMLAHYHAQVWNAAELARHARSF